MKFQFPEEDSGAIVNSLKEALAGRKLGKMVSFSQDSGGIRVTIAKMGKSTIDFDDRSIDGGREWALRKEKIALSHRAFKDEVIEKIIKVVESVGGKSV